MSRAWGWFRENAEAVMVVVTVLGFAATLWQLREANTALRANNSYEVQKDARQILTDLFLKDEPFRSVLAGKSPHDAHSLDNLWLMLNFWRSIYRQENAGGLQTEYTNSIHDEFCEFMNKPPVKEGWNKLLAEKRIGEGHVQMRNAWCPGS